MEYIVNKNSQMGTDFHTIHTKECNRKPKEKNFIDLQNCMCPIEAKNRAKQYFNNVSGCKYCCNEIFFKNKKD